MVTSPFIPQFLMLDDILSRHVDLWQGVPFDCLDLPWRDTHPELCRWLDAQSLSSLQTFKESPQLLIDAVSAWLPECSQLHEASVVPEHTTSHLLCDGVWATGIPGRKWSQIQAFNQSLPPIKQGRWLEWCAGKGYLGRMLAVSRDASVTSLEWQKALCEDGQAYADKHNLAMRFVQGDAFSLDNRVLLDECDHAVALHACGDLHVTLLRHAVNTAVESVTVSPCCYHLIQHSAYQPLSRYAQNSSLTLSRHDLKLPLQETVTAGQTVKNKRFIEVSFRLGFDALQRTLNKVDCYLPVPNVQKSLLNEGFSAFCHWAAEQKNITLPAGTDFEHYQQVGEVRFHHVEKMETVRTLFRRPLEIWLVLDRAIYLQENGFDVDVTTFCKRELTPRNLFIHAIRKG
ncbi:methyltransferase [Enterovibrio nigricans]|uniref:Methyltransferase domain-containing protein n=1 Tax=Enterovibrio nigricans DSM 22720 TaxID=1121868 RepID=A0A1T4U5L1_9GAMM|nr:methyltransferase [Enterovibrio nigricans]PKF51330.1 methyltransferase [Enterovibrio nigricans]SKA47957.1 Methyltransferase domain-containing protein [Enterovibrio nigricans DSM 22720]